MKIYTRTGDKGQTSLFNGQRVAKNDQTITALGSVDECNTAIGLALALIPDALSQVREELVTVQHALFDVGAAIATPLQHSTEKKLEKTRFDAAATALLETWMDAHEEKLPALKTFILPGGHPSAAQLHVARSFCRRAERDVIPLKENEELSVDVPIYLNRLSDYLFVVSRVVNKNAGTPETPWDPHHGMPAKG